MELKFKSETSAVIFRACVACGAPNPEGKEKCPECGARSSPPEDLGVISRTEE